MSDNNTPVVGRITQLTDKQDKRYLTMAVLGAAAICAAGVAGIMLMLGMWWPWPVTMFCGGLAFARAYRMGQTDGMEYGDYNE